MKNKPLSKCPIVQITFLDHAQHDGEGEAAQIELFGRLIKEDRHAYQIASWICDSTIDDNAVTFSVIKHKGLKMRRLK